MSSDEINLEEILLQNHFHILDTLKNVYLPDTNNKNMYERLMNGINDICKQLLELAAENATADLFETDDSLGEIIVNKQSILNTIKQVK